VVERALAGGQRLERAALYRALEARRIRTGGSRGLHILGWLAILALPQLVREMTTAELVLLLAGGLLYTAGAIVFATRRPDPSPMTFGYHEVWHSFMVAAAACHYAMILLLLLPR